MDMMLDAAGDPAVGIVDPKGVWPICSGHLPLSGDRAAALSRDALLDLEQVEFQCPLSGGGLAIKKLTARCFDASSNITNVTAAYSGEPGLWWRRCCMAAPIAAERAALALSRAHRRACDP